jgi:hypothetical protein
MLGTAYGSDVYLSTIIESPASTQDTPPQPVNTSDFHLTKAGQWLKFVPSKGTTANPNPGTAVIAQISLQHVDCASEGNDKGKTGYCGISQDPTKCTGAGKPQACCTGKGTGPSCVKAHGVLDISVRQYLSTLLSGSEDIMHVAGIQITFSKGAATFDATGKNKADGSAVFGGLVSAFTNQKAGFHVTLVRTQGSNPSDCSNVPLSPGNGCLDGTEFGLTGITTGP